MKVFKLSTVNAYCHVDDSDCEVTYSRIPVMSERHAWRIADALGLSNWDQGPGRQFAQIWYDRKSKHLVQRYGWDI